MLLTSSQVSVAVSSGIVFLCTAALFLSGYVIQQRTLRDLRAAIKPSPRPSPKIFLPDRFKQSTTELADGTIIVLDGGGGGGEEQEEKPVVEVKPTLPDGAVAEDGDDVDSPESPAEDEPTKTAKSDTKTDEKEKGADPAAEDGSDQPQKPMSRAERRRRIKEEIMRLSQGEERGYYQRRLW
ncbi:hypothetical protein C8A01DRAFT_44820 [Parachaetomium inaequale]|uniref:Uncharacterized protein n=1 Tax=Parachaetomium inaequale TaxID=2588326 RepID=A0AAN6STY6_9PEZI|nr:hypothetical protein C8A01DRAFT_44820 [Parachaetomium inaequale]